MALLEHNAPRTLAGAEMPSVPASKIAGILTMAGFIALTAYDLASRPDMDASEPGATGVAAMDDWRGNSARLASGR